MCLNYEEQLVQAQTKVADLERQLATMERYKEQLSKETFFRKQMEEKWAESKEEHKTQVSATNGVMLKGDSIRFASVRLALQACLVMPTHSERAWCCFLFSGALNRLELLFHVTFKQFYARSKCFNWTNHQIPVHLFSF